jgi:hypothetical protein
LRIVTLSGKLLHEVLGCAPAIILTVFFCKEKIFPPFEESTPKNYSIFYNRMTVCIVLGAFLKRPSAEKRWEITELELKPDNNNDRIFNRILTFKIILLKMGLVDSPRCDMPTGICSGLRCSL